MSTTIYIPFNATETQIEKIQFYVDSLKLDPDWSNSEIYIEKDLDGHCWIEDDLAKVSHRSYSLHRAIVDILQGVEDYDYSHCDEQQHF